MVILGSMQLVSFSSLLVFVAFTYFYFYLHLGQVPALYVFLLFFLNRLLNYPTQIPTASTSRSGYTPIGT